MFLDQIVKRRTFYMLVVLSFLPCVMTLILWLVSYRFPNHLISRLPGVHNGLATLFQHSFDRGNIMLRGARLPPPTPHSFTSCDGMGGNDGLWPTWRIGRHAWSGVSVGSGDFFQYIGFGYRVGSSPFLGFWVAPGWFLLLLTAIPVLAWRAIKRPRPHLGIAGVCTCRGYDLRATPARCPECGTAPPPTQMV